MGALYGAKARRGEKNPLPLSGRSRNHDEMNPYDAAPSTHGITDDSSDPPSARSGMPGNNTSITTWPIVGNLYREKLGGLIWTAHRPRPSLEEGRFLCIAYRAQFQYTDIYWRPFTQKSVAFPPKTLHTRTRRKSCQENQYGSMRNINASANPIALSNAESTFSTIRKLE